VSQPLDAASEPIKDCRAEAELMGALELLSRHLADADCSECQGDGLDWEGHEWTICDCVLAKVHAENEDHS